VLYENIVYLALLIYNEPNMSIYKRLNPKITIHQLWSIDF